MIEPQRCYFCEREGTRGFAPLSLTTLEGIDTTVIACASSRACWERMRRLHRRERRERSRRSGAAV